MAANRRKQTQNISESLRKGVVTPRGIAAWAFLNKPDNYDKHSIRIYFTDQGEEYQDWLADMTRLENEWRQVQEASGTVDSPSFIQLLEDEETAQKAGVPLGTPFANFASGVFQDDDGKDIPIRVMDAKAQLDPSAQVWSGDLVRVQVNIAGTNSSHGVRTKGWLSAVQLLKSNGGGGGSAFQDESEDFQDDGQPQADNSFGADLPDEAAMDA